MILKITRFKYRYRGLEIDFVLVLAKHVRTYQCYDLTGNSVIRKQPVRDAIRCPDIRSLELRRSGRQTTIFSSQGCVTVDILRPSNKRLDKGILFNTALSCILSST